MMDPVLDVCVREPIYSRYFYNLYSCYASDSEAIVVQYEATLCREGLNQISTNTPQHKLPLWTLFATTAMTTVKIAACIANSYVLSAVCVSVSVWGAEG